MAELKSLINRMLEDGSFDTITRNPLAQFGSEARRYVGATFLPERAVPSNMFREANIRYRPVLAKDGTAYSPAQIVGRSATVGEMLVELSYSDIAQQLKGEEYDRLQEMVRMGGEAEAEAEVRLFLDNMIRGLVELDELRIWQALINAQVTGVGQNGRNWTVDYPNPANHRANAGGAWSNDAYDPFDDIVAMVDLLDSKGYRVSRIITSSRVVNLMASNPKVQQRSGVLQISESGTLAMSGAFGIRSAANNSMTNSGLPIIETYDLSTEAEDGTITKFIPDDVMVFVSQTGRNATVTLETGTQVVPDTLGYLAVGRAAGQAQPGRVSFVEPFFDKPPRLEAQAWQATMPVITEPEAIAVIKSIA